MTHEFIRLCLTVATGITPQQVLEIRQDEHKQADVADFFRISQSTVCKILKSDWEEGYLRPQKNLQDGITTDNKTRW